MCDHLFIFMRYGNLHISRIKIDIETDELIPYEFMELSREEWDTVIEELDEDLFIKVRTIFHLKFGTNIEKKKFWTNLKFEFFQA